MFAILCASGRVCVWPVCVSLLMYVCQFSYEEYLDSCFVSKLANFVALRTFKFNITFNKFIEKTQDIYNSSYSCELNKRKSIAENFPWCASFLFFSAYENVLF